MLQTLAGLVPFQQLCLSFTFGQLFEPRTVIGIATKMLIVPVGIGS